MHMYIHIYMYIYIYICVCVVLCRVISSWCCRVVARLARLYKGC